MLKCMLWNSQLLVGAQSPCLELEMKKGIGVHIQWEKPKIALNEWQMAQNNIVIVKEMITQQPQLKCTTSTDKPLKPTLSQWKAQSSRKLSKISGIAICRKIETMWEREKQTCSKLRRKGSAIKFLWQNKMAVWVRFWEWHSSEDGLAQKAKFWLKMIASKSLMVPDSRVTASPKASKPRDSWKNARIPAELDANAKIREKAFFLPSLPLLSLICRS